MTREEAIKHIKDIICENNTVKHSDMVVFEGEKEALRMAIQALSQKSCEECKYKTFTELYFHTDPEMIEQDPCETCGYAEGSSFCLQYCPYDADRTGRK